MVGLQAAVVCVSVAAHNERSRHRGRLAWYGATVFLSSALLLVLEVVAGRLIAPYVGVSLYTWTSVIGVILAGLSLGNWLGGVQADRGAGERSAGVILGLAGLTSVALLLTLTLVAPVIQDSELDLLSASFLYVLSLFFVPAALIGMVGPLLTAMALRLDARAGHVVGRMHALAALGSILGTFAAGYWLIQYFGTRVVVTATAVALVLLASPFLFRRGRALVPLLLIAALLVALPTWLRMGFAQPCDRESQYYCIRVVDVPEMVPFGNARIMVLDHLMHSVNHATDAAMLVSPYVQLMDELVLDHFGERAASLRYFFAGGGGYTLPRAVLETAGQAVVTVAEIDPQVTRTAAARMYVSLERMRILTMDARVALERMPAASFDVIVGDVFHDVVVPYHFVTAEYARLVRTRLAADGLYVLNIVDAPDDPLLVKSLVKTLRGEFRYVHVWLEEGGAVDQRQTWVISASNARAPPATLTAQRGFDRRWLRVTEQVEANGTPMRQLPMLTDDYAPVERLVSDLLLSNLGV